MGPRSLNGVVSSILCVSLAATYAAPATSYERDDHHATSVTTSIENAYPADSPNSDRSDIKQQETITKGFELFLQLTEGMPENLQQLPTNSPEVQQWLRDNDRLPIVVPYFDALSCAWGVTQFLIEIGFPAAKVWKVVKSYGGLKTFSKAVWHFIEHGTYPADAGQETIELFQSLFGIEKIVPGCS